MVFNCPCVSILLLEVAKSYMGASDWLAQVICFHVSIEGKREDLPLGISQWDM